MTDTTPHFGWPFPEPADARGAGANTIRDGLLGVEATTRTDNTEAVILLAESGGTAATGGTRVTFPGTQAGMAGFSYAPDGALTYTGPAPRMFHVAASVEVENGGAETVDQSVYLDLNNTEADSSYDRIVVPGTPVGNRSVVHKVGGPMVLLPGTVITCRAFATPAGTVGNTSIRAYPAGPLLT